MNPFYSTGEPPPKKYHNNLIMKPEPWIYKILHDEGD
jgi:hypothetical protein